MKSYLFLYIQTATIPVDYNITPENFEKWPRAITISWILNNSSNSFIIRPTGFHINPETSNYIGITNERAINKGKDIIIVLEQILTHLRLADYVVGHNVEYHLNILKSELYRNNMTDKIPDPKTICLMNYGKEFTKISTNNGYKYPTLSELYKFINKTDLNNEYRKANYSQIPEIAHYNLYALQNCFNYMLACNTFTNIQINPIINYFVIPFKNDNYPNIKNLKLENSNLFIGKTNIFHGITKIQEFKDYGLYVIQIPNGKTLKYILLDYRGVLIYESETPIDVYFHIGLEENGIFLDNYMLYNITFGEFGIVIHQYDSLISFKNLIIITDFFQRKTVINNQGKVILENVNLIYDKESDYIISKTDEYSKIYDCQGTNIVNFSNSKFDIYEINSTNQFYYRSKEMQGLIDLGGQIIIYPSNRYIKVLNNEYYYFSNNIYIYKEEVVPNFIGLAETTGKILLEDVYDKIYIENNKIFAEKDGEEFLFKIN